ncbi:hypothetical protein NKR23_g2665 [Pleurostoma richardsiae]|uniref:Luciferase domain-containing protein n=1 Tax=Pleurostoma richardsiae TaxID=41990 RepID=A0AA38VUH0_9PEZI|nr:hypothetical protein NKR23_g2665 [Pleurostoma richardsiae]
MAHVSESLTTLTTTLRAHPYLSSTALAAAIALLPVLRSAYASYQGFLALGPGGPPHNVIGWLGQGLLRPFATADVRDPDVFVPRTGDPPYATTSFLGAGGALPQRAGERPVVPGYIAPQRQMTQHSSASTRDALEAALVAAARANPAALAVRPSGLERRGYPAVWLGDAATPAARAYLRRTRGEFTHVHPDGSTHVVLSLPDAQEAVRKGWAERHPLSGSRGFWPLGYLLVYAPRDEAEVEVWRRLVAASLRFVTAVGGEEAKVEW